MNDHGRKTLKKPRFKGFPKETIIINNQGSQHNSLLLFVPVDRKAVGSTSTFPIQLHDENGLHG
jgi:hypothetical protein